MNLQPSSGDLTPVSGSQTDIAPLGRGTPPPAHERTAEEEATRKWTAVEQQPEFQALLKAKARFIVPATAFFVVYYFILPISVGWFPKAMASEVWGHVNVAYLYAFSQFIMAWVLAALYVKAAAGWDRQASALLTKLDLH